MNFSSPKRVVRDDTVKYYKDVVELAVDLECPMTNLLPGYGMHGISPQQAWEWMIECTSEVVDFAEKNDITIVLEPLASWEATMISTSEEALRLIKQISSKKFGVMLDAGNLNTSEPNIVEAIRKVGKYLWHFHVADNDGSTPAHLPPGRGNIDFEAVIESLRDVGYTGWLSDNGTVCRLSHRHKCVGYGIENLP